MHETVIAWNILEKVSQRAVRLNEQALVTRVSVRVGEFTNVEPESLRFAFDSMRTSYACCKFSELNLLVVETLATCNGEGHFYHPKPAYSFKCPECGSGIKEIMAGEELEIIDIELTVPDEEEKQQYAWANDGTHSGAPAGGQ